MYTQLIFYCFPNPVPMVLTASEFTYGFTSRSKIHIFKHNQDSESAIKDEFLLILDFLFKSLVITIRR